MKINIRSYGDLSKILGEQNAVDLEDEVTLSDLITKLEEKIGKKGLFLSYNNKQKSTLTILVNGRNIQALNGLRTILKNGDTVVFIPLVVGG